MKKQEVLIVGNEDQLLSFTELCEVCHAPTDLIYEYISFEIIQPHGQMPSDWKFDSEQLKRIQTAMRLQHDLEVNMQGIAIILDLLEEIQTLREKTKLFEKHYHI